MPSSKVKLGLPMMISGMSFSTRSMTSAAATLASSLGVRYRRVLASSFSQYE